MQTLSNLIWKTYHRRLKALEAFITIFKQLMDQHELSTSQAYIDLGKFFKILQEYDNMSHLDIYFLMPIRTKYMRYIDENGKTIMVELSKLILDAGVDPLEVPITGTVDAAATAKAREQLIKVLQCDLNAEHIQSILMGAEKVKRYYNKDSSYLVSPESSDSFEEKYPCAAEVSQARDRTPSPNPKKAT